MADNNIEYEKEPHPNYLIDGKPVYYAKNVPDLLRGDLTLTGQEQLKVSTLNSLFSCAPTKLAERGAQDWNLWVKVNHEQWFELIEHDSFLLFAARSRENELQTISFSFSLDRIAQNRYNFPSVNFSNFIFPCDVTFEGINFIGNVGFIGANFIGDVFFLNTRFLGNAIFDQSWFFGATDFTDSVFDGTAGFSEVQFLDEVSFVGCRFKGNAVFANVLTHSYVDLSEAFFEGLCSFVEARFVIPPLIHAVTFKSKVSFNKSVFSVEGIERYSFVDSLEFTNCQFYDHVSFDEVEFCCHVHFNKSAFSSSVSFVSSFFQHSFALKCIKLNSVALNESNFKSAVVLDVQQMIGAFHASKTVFCAGFTCTEVEFEATVSIEGSVFEESASFNGSKFTKSFSVRNTLFSGFADFSDCHFSAHVDMDFANFDVLPYQPIGVDLSSIVDSTLDYIDHSTPKTSEAILDFSGTVFTLAPNLGTTIVNMPLKPICTLPWWQKWSVDTGLGWKIADSEAASKYRRLQELAREGHHHLAEKRFFRAELIARRGHEANTWREVAMINLFEWFSQCGLSFWRPMGWLLGVTVLSGLFYSAQIDWSDGYGSGFELVSYSIANSLPLLGYISDSYGVSVQVLFGGIENVPGWVRVYAFMQNAVSAIFIFFGLLAIRNYFKLG